MALNWYLSVSNIGECLFFFFFEGSSGSREARVGYKYSHIQTDIYYIYCALVLGIRIAQDMVLNKAGMALTP